MPLFILFWIADIICAPGLKWEFLGIRLAIIPLCLTLVMLTKRLNHLVHLEIMASLYAICLALGINLMIFLIADPSTPYYAGLNLVAIGTLSFIPFSRNFYVATAAGIYLPYYAITLSRISSNNWHGLAVNSFFIISSVCMCFLIRFFHASTMVQETEAKLDLKAEILNRETIIRSKN